MKTVCICAHRRSLHNCHYSSNIDRSILKVYYGTYKQLLHVALFSAFPCQAYKAGNKIRIPLIQSKQKYVL